MANFWDYSVWGSINLIAVLLLGLLVGNILKKTIKILQQSLIPTSVLAGGILIIVAGIYKAITGDVMFDTAFFGGNGTETLEMITYHTLALGFIASTFKSSDGKLSKKRLNEIFNTGVTTVSTYLLQAVLGMGITMIVALIVGDFFAAAGVLLPFGYGQGTGQALNYGNIFETDFGFVGGKSFGLTIAALGFLSASIGGVIHLNILKKRKAIKVTSKEEGIIEASTIQSENEIPMQESIDKLTIQVALVIFAYMIAFLIMTVLGKFLPGMRSVIFGFNFLLGVLAATIVKFVMNQLKKRNIMKKEYINDFLMTRTSNFFYDIMVVAGIAAIRISTMKGYLGLLLIICIAGGILTFAYNYFVSRVLFKEYQDEQLVGMYGMLTGTASTGIVLLRELDPEFETPVSDNMVYQNFPAIIFGLPLMLIAAQAPENPVGTWLIALAFFLVLNIILFRSKIVLLFKKK